jgi:FAD/FMN-containing dehydrogenase
MKFRLHKLGTVVGGMILHHRSNARAVLQFYREFMKTAPETITLYAALLHTPDGIPVIGLIGCYSGDPENADAVLKPLREFGTPIADLMQPMPYTALQTMLDAPFPHGNRYYWKSGFLNALSDEAIDTIIEYGATVTSPITSIILEMYGGAATREPEGGTAFPHRQAEYDLVIISNWVNKEEDNTHIWWTRSFYESMQPFASNKAYVNVLGVEGRERVKEAYGDNYARLLDLKEAYDPINLFRLNQNITREQ